MPLTPTDVANKQFRIAFRGYSLDEVDAFLDEVETELSRLLRNNAEFKDRPATATAGASSAAAPRAPMAGMESQEAALRTLLLAQRTADEAIAEAQGEAEQIVAAARAEAESTLTSARAEAESTLASARAEAETTLTGARTEAKSTLESARAEAASTLSTSKDKADRVDEEVASRIHAATGDLDARRRTLETRIEELRAFEREYRTRLKAYLQGQLRDLDSRTGPDDGSVGVPAAARTSAVGVTPTTGPRPAVAAAPDDGVPAGPPREAGADANGRKPGQQPGGPLRSVPQVPGGGQPVGPFTVVPASRPDGADATPTDGR